MDTDRAALENLSPDECMRLMGSVAVGRIVYSRRALPAVELVNFALVDGDIVIRTSAEGKLAAATRGAVVAFEADAVELDGHAGWSVAIVGQARAVSDAEEIGRLERVALTSWVPGCGGHFIRISPTIVNGRRVCGQRLAPSALAPRDRRRLSRSISGCAGHE
jgi:nitroimidazol reductase NimA-like FMN-containing flavoprotein (pyridoxamine 5'-phosphate oxidase superfamily)